MLQKNVSLEKLIMGSLGILNYLSTKKVRFWLNVWHPKKNNSHRSTSSFFGSSACGGPPASFPDMMSSEPPTMPGTPAQKEEKENFRNMLTCQATDPVCYK